MADTFAHLQFAHLCCNFSAILQPACSQHAASISMQPACSQHAARLQHAARQRSKRKSKHTLENQCTLTPYERTRTRERKSKHTLENQSTLSRILHNNNFTTRERKSKHTLEIKAHSLPTQQQLYYVL